MTARQTFSSHAEEIAAMGAVLFCRPRIFLDLTTLARAIRAEPEHRRRRRIEEITDAAEAAFDFGRRHGRTHPSGGDGSISTACHATGNVAPEGDLMDRDWIACMKLALLAMEEILDLEDARASRAANAGRMVG